MTWLRSFLNIRSLIVLTLLLTASLAAWGLFGRQASVPQPAAPTQATPPARPEMEALSLTEVEEGGKRWTLEARNAEYLRDRNEIRITDIEVEFFGKGDRVLKISCEEGLINTKTKSLTLKGQVLLQDGELVIKTGTVHYQPKEKVLLAPEDVVLESPRVKIQGKGLRVELDGRRLTLSQHQSTEVRMKGRDWPL